MLIRRRFCQASLWLISFHRAFSIPLTNNSDDDLFLSSSAIGQGSELPSDTFFASDENDPVTTIINEDLGANLFDPDYSPDSSLLFSSAGAGTSPLEENDFVLEDSSSAVPSWCLTGKKRDSCPVVAPPIELQLPDLLQDYGFTGESESEPEGVPPSPDPTVPSPSTDQRERTRPSTDPCIVGGFYYHLCCEGPLGPLVEGSTRYTSINLCRVGT